MIEWRHRIRETTKRPTDSQQEEIQPVAGWRYNEAQEYILSALQQYTQSFG
jgi:hypothetical protein